MVNIYIYFFFVLFFFSHSTKQQDGSGIHRTRNFQRINRFIFICCCSMGGLFIVIFFCKKKKKSFSISGFSFLILFLLLVCVTVVRETNAVCETRSGTSSCCSGGKWSSGDFVSFVVVLTTLRDRLEAHACRDHWPR